MSKKIERFLAKASQNSLSQALKTLHAQDRCGNYVICMQCFATHTFTF